MVQSGEGLVCYGQKESFARNVPSLQWSCGYTSSYVFRNLFICTLKAETLDSVWSMLQKIKGNIKISNNSIKQPNNSVFFLYFSTLKTLLSSLIISWHHTIFPWNSKLIWKCYALTKKPNGSERWLLFSFHNLILVFFKKIYRAPQLMKLTRLLLWIVNKTASLNFVIFVLDLFPFCVNLRTTSILMELRFSKYYLHLIIKTKLSTIHLKNHAFYLTVQVSCLEQSLC